MNAPTPGPWHAGGTFLPGTPDAHCSIWSAPAPGYQSGDQVAQQVAPRDANLIAAAPELLSTLIALEQAYSNTHSPQHRAACLSEARAAIAKAEGRS